MSQRVITENLKDLSAGKQNAQGGVTMGADLLRMVPKKEWKDLGSGFEIKSYPIPTAYITAQHRLVICTEREIITKISMKTTTAFVQKPLQGLCSQLSIH